MRHLEQNEPRKIIIETASSVVEVENSNAGPWQPTVDNRVRQAAWYDADKKLRKLAGYLARVTIEYSGPDAQSFSFYTEIPQEKKPSLYALTAQAFAAMKERCKGATLEELEDFERLNNTGTFGTI